MKTETEKSDGELFFESAKHGFWDSYDVLGRLVIVNLVAVVLCVSVVGLPVAAALVAGFSKRVADGESPTSGELFAIRKMLVPVCVGGGILVALTALAWFNARMYLGPIFHGHPAWGLFLGGMTIWFWIAGILVTLLWISLRLWMESRLPFWKMASCLLLKHGGVFFMTLLQCVALCVIFVLSGFGVFVVGFVSPVLTWFEVFRAVACREGLIDAPREPETRGFRHLLRPWAE